jgi:hypothetical protein
MLPSPPRPTAESDDAPLELPNLPRFPRRFGLGFRPTLIVAEAFLLP